jgi:MOSC domain-containing protein YiiM
MTARVTDVCVVHELIPDRGGSLPLTAIDKRALDGAVSVGRYGLSGDSQYDQENHGGLDQAVYVYSTEEAARWAEELGYDIPPGRFGENLRTAGLAVTDAVVGETWQVGEPGIGPLLQVRSPRVPCSTFAGWMDEPRWVKRFTVQGDVGAYVRVLNAGEVTAGDRIEVMHRPEHAVTVRQVFESRRRMHLDAMGRLLAEGDDLDPVLVTEVRKTLELAGR